MAGIELSSKAVTDLEDLGRDQRRVEAFPGVIFLFSGRYPQRARSNGAIVRDLAELADAPPAPDALSGRVIWLGGQ